MDHRSSGAMRSPSGRGSVVRCWSALPRHTARTSRTQEMAELVQEHAGVTTGMPFRHWIGRVLGEVSRLERPNEPLLTSLVVRADGTIGDGYIIPIRERGEA